MYSMPSQTNKKLNLGMTRTEFSHTSWRGVNLIVSRLIAVSWRFESSPCCGWSTARCRVTLRASGSSRFTSKSTLSPRAVARGAATPTKRETRYYSSHSKGTISLDACFVVGYPMNNILADHLALPVICVLSWNDYINQQDQEGLRAEHPDDYEYSVFCIIGGFSAIPRQTDHNYW